ncbi:MAG: hypothetical protein IT209_08005 [Armatimonadetes bacterium]|nr:hypothetical protein [Armatimonadota bacterium]
MTKTNHFLHFAAVCVAVIAGAGWPAVCSAKARTDTVRINTTWDANYFYASFDVNDQDIQGTTRGPNQVVGDDDAVAVYFQSDRSKGSQIGPHSFRMMVSAAGGAEWAVGDNGKWVKKDIVTFKYAVRREGTLNQDQDDDTGYQVELAIPWSEMGVKGEVGTIVGFNAAVQMKGEHTGFLSITPDIKTEADLDNPSKWQELWLRGPVQPLVVNVPGRVLCNRAVNTPTVDGRLLPSEYALKTAFELVKPAVSSARHILRDFPIENLILSSYYYDLAKAGNPAAFINKPFYGFGPWFSGERIEWHRQQLRDARRAGIDVLLGVQNVAGGPPDTATLALVGALKEMDAAGEDHPLLGVALEGLGDSSDVEALWKAISGFFNLTPPEYRAEVRLPQSRGGQTALIAFLRGGAAVSKEAVEELNKRALAAYGQRIALISAENVGGEADGFTAEIGAEGWSYSDKGWIKIASVTPGFIREGQTLPRRAGQTYGQAWGAVDGKNPDWVFVDSWNRWQDGSEIATSTEYGLLYVDATAIQTSRFNGRSEWAAKYLSSSVPSVISPSYMSLARLSVRNVGTRAWRVTDRVRLTYRWYTGGRLYSQGLVTVPVQKDVPINGISNVAIGVVAVDKDRDPLPAGDWTVVFDFTGPDGLLFSSSGDRPLAVPVKVGEPAPRAYTVLASTLPAYLMAGQVYSATVAIRNEGSETWKKAGPLNVLISAHGAQQQELSVWTASLPKDVEPGAVVEVPVILGLKDPRLLQATRPVWFQVTLAEGQRSVKADSGHAASFAALLGASDYGAKLTPPAKPLPPVTFGAPAKFQIEVANTGVQEWREQTRLVAQWYSLDGQPLLSEGGEAKLRKGIKPGENLTANAELKAPPYPGQYVVRWTPFVGSAATTTDPLGGPTDGVFTQYVTVQGPAVAALDLAQLFDSNVEIAETQGGGAFGPQGALPAEAVPPLVIPATSPSGLFPSGLYQSADGGPQYAGVSSRRWISFLWPPKSDSGHNAISANRQSVTVPSGAWSRVHVLAASASEAKSAEFTLVYGSSPKTQNVRVGSWQARGEGDVVAYEAPYTATESGVKASPAFLYDVVISVDPAEGLSAIKLPRDSDIKVLGISLEAAEAAH